MNNYKVLYGTGAGDFEMTAPLEDVMKEAEEGVAYTQKSVRICIKEKDEYGDDNLKVVAILPWWGYEPEEDEEVTCQFGDFGFYGAWEVLV